MIDHNAGRTLVMGVLNVTPDSFSDGGRYESVETAVAHAEALVTAGADIIDVGGESTRPGAVRIPGAVERDRVLPVVRELVSRRIVVSVDTMNARTATEVAAAGASLINDVSGGRADVEMVDAVVETGLPYVVTHSRGPSGAVADYGDVVEVVARELSERVSELVARGLNSSRLVLDPGLGFAKTSADNWQILGQLDRFVSLGFPVLVGASRKRFLGALLGADAPVVDRDFSTATISALAAKAQVWAVRVHDVGQTRAALNVAEAWTGGARA